MNQSQVKYARGRAEAIRRDKISAIKQKYTTPAVTLSNSDKIKALKSGDFTLNEDLVKNSYYWYQVIQFNGENAMKYNTEAANKEIVKVESAFTSLMDELVLGDNEEALRLLSAFEKI